MITENTTLRPLLSSRPGEPVRRYVCDVAAPTVSPEEVLRSVNGAPIIFAGQLIVVIAIESHSSVT